MTSIVLYEQVSDYYRKEPDFQTLFSRMLASTRPGGVDIIWCVPLKGRHSYKLIESFANVETGDSGTSLWWTGGNHDWEGINSRLRSPNDELSAKPEAPDLISLEQRGLIVKWANSLPEPTPQDLANPYEDKVLIVINIHGVRGYRYAKERARSIITAYPGTVLGADLP